MTAAYISHSQYGTHKHTAVFTPQGVPVHRGASLLSFRLVFRRLGFPERSINAVRSPDDANQARPPDRHRCFDGATGFAFAGKSLDWGSALHPLRIFDGMEDARRS